MSYGLINSWLFNFIPDISLQLQGAGYVRRMQIGNNWTRIRIGMLISITPDPLRPVDTLLEQGLYFGLSSSRANPISSFNGVNFLGARLFGNGTATYAANSGNPVYTGVAYLLRKVNDLIMTQVVGATTFAVAQTYTGARDRRTPIIVDFIRPQGGGQQATLTVYGCTAAVAAVDFRPDHLAGAIDNWGTPTIYGQTLTSLVTSSTIWQSETFGEFDQLDLYWSRHTPLLELYAIGGVSLLPGYYSDAFGGAVEDFGGGTIAYSQGFIGSGTTVGYASTGSAYGYYATSVGSPFDNFEAYPQGTIYQDFGALGLGLGWAGAGTFLAS